MNQQHLRIALGVTVAGVLYLAYTKYVEFEQRQERLENNLRNVINAVNNHYISQLDETETSEVVSDVISDIVSEASDEIEHVHKRVIFEEDEDEDDEPETMAACMADSHEEYQHSDTDTDSEEGPIIITKTSHCIYTITMGKNKGRRCGKKSGSDGYCKLHEKHIPSPM
jgi:hypothetical protein